LSSLWQAVDATRRDYDCLDEWLCELGKELPSVLRRHAGRIVQHNGGGKSVDNHVENRMRGDVVVVVIWGC
jgi:hypothetical protein